MKQKNIKEILKDYFFTHPTVKIRVRELERALTLSLPSVIRYCKELEEEGIVTTVCLGSVRFYTPNRGSEHYLLEKKISNIKKIYTSGIIQYLKINLGNPAVILFGSFSKGEDTETSDIDLYVETVSPKKIGFDQFEKLLNKNIHVVRHTSLRLMRNKNLANNIINGIILNNQVEVFT